MNLNTIYRKICQNLSVEWYPVWNSSSPDFTGCFQFIDAPLFLIFYTVLCIPYIIWLRNQLVLKNGYGMLFLLKIIIIGLLACVQMSEFIYNGINWSLSIAPVAFCISNVCLIYTLMINLMIIIFEKQRNAINSGFYFNYWLLFFFLYVIRSRTVVLMFLSGKLVFSRTHCTFILFNLILSTISLSLSFLSDRLMKEKLDGSSKRFKPGNDHQNTLDNSDVVELQTIDSVIGADERNAGIEPELKECPETYQSFIVRMSFVWVTPLIIKGYKRSILVSDLWRLNIGDRCQDVVSAMRNYLQSKKQSSNVQGHLVSLDCHDGTDIKKVEPFDLSFVYALLRTHWADLLISGLYRFAHDCLLFLGPILLKLLLEFVSDGTDHLWKGYLYTALILVTGIIRSVLLNQYFYLTTNIGMRIRTSIISLVYRKSLVLSVSSRKDSTAAEMVNLMSIDAQKFMESTIFIHMIWGAPFQIIGALFLLWRELGPAVLAGVVVLLLLIPVNGLIGIVTRKLQNQLLKFSDQRIKLMNEIFNSIKVIKLYAWELSFMKYVTDIRSKELNIMRKCGYLNAITTFSFNCAPFIVSLTSFGTFVMFSSSSILTAEKAFVSISLFNILRYPLLILPIVISNMIQISVSLKRVTQFLKRDEIQNDSVQHKNISGEAVSIINGSFSWDCGAKSPILKQINFVVPQHQLVAIVGRVGAGKSSVLSALIGEMYKLEGTVNVNGSIAYVPQQAWILNQTIRNNILFHSPFDARKYQRVLVACCLIRDLEMLKDGDQTVIGDRGINLSGGQKQRISLARACYSEVEIVLMDDPLNAVDSQVGKYLIDNVFGPRGILAGRTRILVTHNLMVLPICDCVTVLQDGAITESGSFYQLIKDDGIFSKFVAIHVTKELKKSNSLYRKSSEIGEPNRILLILRQSLTEEQNLNENFVSAKKQKRFRDRIEVLSSEDMVRNIEQIIAEDFDTDDNDVFEPENTHSTKKKRNNNVLIESESSKVKNVELSVYATYIRSVGLWMSISILLLFVIMQAFTFSTNLWLVKWSDDGKYRINFNTSTGESYINNLYQRNWNFGIYGLLGLGQVIALIIGTFLFATGTVRASERLHEHLLSAIMHCPMTMFDQTPTGRILNRFSSDIYSVASQLPRAINSFIVLSLSSLSVLIMVTLPNPWIIMPLSVITIFYAFIQRFYVTTSRQLKRLESVTKSPIYSHFGQSLQGVASIRAYGIFDTYISKCEEQVDINTSAYYTTISSNRWLAIILESIGNLLVFLAALFSVISIHLQLKVNEGLVGLSVSTALGITQTLNWLVKTSSDVESNMVAVERIQEYSDLESEAPWEMLDKLNDDWPKGAIEFKNYSTRYRETLDLVLDGISFTVNPGEKVGIVGRTGSGKTTLVLALFRILESVNGEILIDGLPIQNLGLHDIRKRVSIIPQDPTLFAGTIRRNLDPLNSKADDEIWKVLELSNLKSFVLNDGNEGLQMIISEGGENLSLGQRQLLSLARALLRQTNILVLDEATAAVDLDTDALIQQAIRHEFPDCTILTIAHRLNTILDYDKIIVLDNGHIVEIGTPSDLLKNHQSHFYSMAKNANAS